MTEIVKSKDLRTKILLIIGAMIVIRIGSIIPIPGVNADYMKSLLNNTGLAFLNVITGNSLSRMSLFALSISPYITASIIIQLLMVVFPALEEMNKDGKTGREKVEKITNITGVSLAFFQALFMAIGFGTQGLLEPYTWWMVLIMTAIWTSGAAILMVIGNRITKMDIGNGISYILLCNILSTFPSDLLSVYQVFVINRPIGYQVLNSLFAASGLIVLIIACIILSASVRKIPMTFSGKMDGRSPRQDLPVQLNLCGVIPVIFTSSIMSMPILLSSFMHDVEWLAKISRYLNQQNWFNPDSMKYTIGVVPYVLLTYFFTSFYLNVNFNAIEIANNLKQQGAVIPGIRPGKPTQEYIEKIAIRMAMLGATCTLGIILITCAVCNLSGLGALSIGGTSILICVSVIIESSKIFKTAIQSSKSRSFYKKQKGEASLFGLTK